MRNQRMRFLSLNTIIRRSLSTKNNVNIQKKINLVLVRHAESTNNTIHSGPVDLSWRTKRKADCELSDKGKQQTQFLTEYLKSSSENNKLNHLINEQSVFYSSPMKRCLETTLSIVSALPSSTTVNIKSNMFEFGGCYSNDVERIITQTGMTKHEIESNYPNYVCGEGLFVCCFLACFVAVCLFVCHCLMLLFAVCRDEEWLVSSTSS